MKFKYITFSFDGDTFPIAKKLLDEGEDVYVCQIEDANELGIDSWIGDKEKPEDKRRRLSLYDGMLEKHTLSETLKSMEEVNNKDDFFIIFGFNSLYKIADKVVEMGYTKGIFPTEEDFNREKDRQKSKDFVREYYPGLIVREIIEMDNVDETIKFIEESDKIWCVKSDGNFGETIVPGKNDLEIAKRQTISELLANKKQYDKGKLCLEEKIISAIEFAPQMAFWDGKPIYSQVEIETRMFGAGDIGPQTGGNQNIVVKTDLDCKLNKIAFPKAMQDIAKTRKGLFLADAGILSDGKKLYFTEFAGNRWGWGGIFSELSASEKEEKMASSYFESVAEGKNPFEYNFGSSLAFYSLVTDDKFADVYREDIPIYLSNEDQDDVFFVQVKNMPIEDQEFPKDENKGLEIQRNDRLVNVGFRGFDSSPLGYAVGRGNTLREAIDSAYKAIEGVSFKGLYFRPKADFLSSEYASSIGNRYNFLIEKGYIKSVEEKYDEVLLIDFDGTIRDNEGDDFDKEGNILGDLIKGADEAIKELSDRGYNIKVFTARTDFPKIRAWFDAVFPEWKNYISDITNIKSSAIGYIDDSATTFESWKEILSLYG